MRGNDLDTDRIIPARYLKEVAFGNMGQYPFYDERFGADGEKKKHPFNDERFSGASILLVNKNFGCGSSREHAPQALMRWGIKAIVGESFAQIFAGNCTMLGIPTLVASPDEINLLMELVEEHPNHLLEVDVQKNMITVDKHEITATMNASAQNALTEGTWDSASLLLSAKDKIKEVATQLPYFNNFGDGQ